MRKQKSFATSFLRFLICTAAFIAGTNLVFAQAGRGGINGVIADDSGAIIPGASVIATNSATGARLSTISTGAGLYTFVSLPPGDYNVTATAHGFDTVVQKGVHVSVDQVSTINLTLKVGAVSDVVTVTSTASLIDTSNSTVGQLIREPLHKFASRVILE